MSDNTLPRPNVGRLAWPKRLFALDFDPYLLIAAAMLCGVGGLMVYSASISASFLATENTSTTYFFSTHMRNIVIGTVMMILLTMIDYRVWKRYSIWIMLVTIVSLVIVLQFGDQRFAAQRALFEGSVQPGEFAKLAVVIYMAAWLSGYHKKLRNISYGLLPFSVFVGVTCILLILQPDLSTAATILATSLTLFFLAGADWIQLFAVAGGAGALGYVVATRIEYANSRIESHLAAIQDLTQANDHVQASVEAFLNGQLFGVGLGEGRQKFGALPFPHTDSIFAVIGEELGLMGSLAVLALFSLLVYRGFVIAKKAPDLFGALLASGIVLWVAYDAILNIAVMTALVPPTGVPLPFISFGGSSLVTAMAGVGLVLSVSRQSSRIPPPERSTRGVVLPLDSKLRARPSAVEAATPPPAPDTFTPRQKQSKKQAPAPMMADQPAPDGFAPPAPEPNPESNSTSSSAEDANFEAASLSGRHGRGNISRVSRRQRDS